MKCHTKAGVLVGGILFLGILQARVAFPGEVVPPGKDEGPSTPIVLKEFKVTEKPLTSFGFSVFAAKDDLTNRVIELTIDGVAPHSEAEYKGLAPLTRVLSIDGRDVREFTASFLKGSDLNGKLMDRRHGDRITLKVWVLGARKPKDVTLTEGLRLVVHSQNPDDIPGLHPSDEVHVTHVTTIIP